MEKIVDARGLQCPMPVIETKKALQEMTEGMVNILVDNSIAVQNLVKMANQKHLECTSEKIDTDNYIVHITVTDKMKETPTSELSATDKTKETPTSESSATDLSTTEIPTIEKTRETTLDEKSYPDSREDHTVIVLSSDHMGEGDDKLGKTLMKGFIYALTELEKLPEHIIMYNGGAKLPVEGSDSLQDLKLLESQGVEILTCGACLNYYELSEKLSVGSVTNMYAIAEIMMSATKVIKP